MEHLNPDQKILLSAEYLFDVKSFSEFETLFSYLPSILKKKGKIGRPKVSSLSSFKCFIYRSISGVKNLSELRRDLLNNPSLCSKCGFDPSHLPPIERFSSFLKETPHAFFERIEIELVRKLTDYRIVSDKYLTIDAPTVSIQCRENNFKTSASDRFNKLYPPKADPEVGLGVMVNYLKPFRKK